MITPEALTPVIINIYIFTNISEGTAFHWPSFFGVLHSTCRAVFILTPPPYTINVETKRKRIAETRARDREGS